MPWPVTALRNIYSSFVVYLALLVVNYVCWKHGWVLTRAESLKPKTGKLTLLYVLLSGKFSPCSPVSSLLSALWNILSMLAVVDFVYRGDVFHGHSPVAFSRLGHVNSTHARIAVRYPVSSAIQIRYKPEGTAQTDEGWRLGQTLFTSDTDDYMVTFHLDGLDEDTNYVYHTNASHSGQFHTTPLAPKRWSFVSTSCIKPFFPYSPMDHSLRIRGLELLSKYIQTNKVEFMLFLGDFIYVDLPTRFGFSPEHYRRLYRQVYASPSWSESLLSLPWLHAYDDHEITNDWSANETGIYNDAIESYMHYQHPANPDPVVDGGTYYTFQNGDVDFFILDTRRYRSPASVADGPAKTMLGKHQRSDLESWLQKGDNWKVVVSSVPFTRNFRGPSSKDSWAGYLWERQEILEKMWSTHGVIIITGVLSDQYLSSMILVFSV